MKTPHISQYLSGRELGAIYKTAEADLPTEERPDWGQRAKLLGSGLLGMGVGTLAGYGAMELANRSYPGGLQASALNKAVPVASAGAGLMYSLWKAREMEKLRRAVKPSSDDKPADQ